MSTVTVCVAVSVTAEDIAAGERRDACYCPVALAIRRALPGEASVAVWPGRVVAFAKLGGEGFPIPASVAGIAAEFDCGRLPEPFDFTLELAMGRTKARAFCQRNGLDYEAAVTPQQATEAA